MSSEQAKPSISNSQAVALALGKQMRSSQLERLSGAGLATGDLSAVMKQIQSAMSDRSADKQLLAKALEAMRPMIENGSALTGVTGLIAPELKKQLEAFAAFGNLTRTVAATLDLGRSNRFSQINRDISGHGFTTAVKPVVPQLPAPQGSGFTRTRVTDPRRLQPRRRQLPVRGRARVRGLVAQPRPRLLPHEVGEVLATQLTRSNRDAAIALLLLAGLDQEREHLNAVEERLSAGTRSAQHHAALSARLVLKGLADHCFPARGQRRPDRFGNQHEVGDIQVGNRLAAFVDDRLRSHLSAEEHRLFVANLTTVTRWSARGPHRIYSPTESGRLFLRLLEVLNVIARAYGIPSQ